MASFFKIIAFINTILFVLMSIYEIKHFKQFILWAFLILLFPILGFVLYIVFGNKLKFYSKKVLQDKQKSTKNFISQTSWYKLNYTDSVENLGITAKHIKENYKSDIWHNNILTIFIDGQHFLNDLINEIKRAKTSINVEFYIFSDDETGQCVADELIKQAKAGVKVKVVYDAFGSRKTNNTFWKKLRDAGINVVEFFPNFLKLPIINFKINYRNHRKLVIIDGKISYTGGVNLRDDHMGKDKNLTPWRDTVIKIVGPATYPLQDFFLNDYLFVSKEKLDKQQINELFPQIESKGKYNLQILDGGPEKSPIIFETFLHIIKNCKKFLYIQTPYFVINNEMQKVLEDAINNGVKINIIIPKRPDKKIVYSATLLCLKPLLKLGVNIYLYSNFIHSKVLLTENALSIGTCNFDNRSFFLNFEDTCLCYDKNAISEQLLQIEKDIKTSEYLTNKKFNKLHKQNFFFSFIYKIISRFL